MKVSVILINYNTCKLTADCIKSIRESTRNLSYEIILFDNNSQKCNIYDFIDENTNLKIIQNEKNLGFAKGINKALKYATGKYILLLNNDTLLTNNAIYIAAEKLEKNPDIGAITVKIKYPDGGLQYPCEKFWSIKTTLAELFRLTKFWNSQKYENKYLGDRFDHQREKECDWIWGTFFMFNRKILEIMPEKKLPDDFFMYAEDMQWCYRIKKAGFKIIYYPKAEIIHFLGASSADDANNRFYNKILPNIYLTIKKEKGKIYAKLLFLCKFLHYLTLTDKTERKKAWYFYKLLRD